MRKLSLAELNRISVDQFKNAEKLPIVIILDNVRSLHNIGSVFRTADAFRVEAIYLCGIAGTPPNKEIHKTALGATESVYWKYFATTTEAIDDLKSKNFTVYAVEQAEGSLSICNLLMERGTKTALIFGNEIHGVSDEAMEMVDGCIEIPQFGTKHSLNISVSVGIVIWEVQKRMRAQT